MIVVKVDESFALLVDSASLQLAAQATLEHQEKSIEGDLSVVVTDDEHIQELNLQYRGIDSPTDVLSFPADFIDPDTGKTYLGDVIISYTKCQEQAQSANHSTEQELILLVIHGVLHLIGYDHIKSKDKEQMWSVQIEILKGLGYNGIMWTD
jgi:probable rRNA maturation factor